MQDKDFVYEDGDVSLFEDNESAKKHFLYDIGQMKNKAILLERKDGKSFNISLSALIVFSMI